MLFIFFVAAKLQRHARLHGTRSFVQRDGLRFERRLVQLRLHALQTAQRPFAIPPAQDEGQARDRPDDVNHGTFTLVCPTGINDGGAAARLGSPVATRDGISDVRARERRSLGDGFEVILLT